MTEAIRFSVPLPPVGLRRNRQTRAIGYRARLVREFQETVWCAGWLALSAWEREKRADGLAARLIHRTNYEGPTATGVIGGPPVVFLPWEKASVHYVWHSTHETDADNIIASMKAALDVLKATGPRPLGIIADDGPGVTVTAAWAKSRTKAEEHCEIEVTRL